MVGRGRPKIVPRPTDRSVRPDDLISNNIPGRHEKKNDLGVPRNSTSRSGSNMLHLHAVADVDQNGEMGKMTEAADARG